MEKYEFSYAFQLTRKIIFEVNYHTIGSNDHPYFSTSANEFNQPKTDYTRCGQAQPDLCTGVAKSFYEKWDFLHTKDLTDEQFHEIIDDIEELKNKYNYIEHISNDGPVRDVSFHECRELSMQNIR